MTFEKKKKNNYLHSPETFLSIQRELKKYTRDRMGIDNEEGVSMYFK